MKKHIDYLKKLDACPEAIPWVAQFDTLQQAWNVCERGDWMLWLVGKQSGEPESKSRKKLVLTACKCARLSLKYVSKDEKRPLIATQTAEKWAKGDDSVSLLDVRNAADAAAAYAADSYAAAYAAYAADSYAAAYAAYAAAYAADAAADAANAAAYAADAAADAAAYAADAAAADAAANAANAADAAADAANAAAYAAAYAAAASKVLKQCANIVREMYPKIRMI